MSAINYISRLERIFLLIKQGRTGNAEQFSRRIGISRRQLFNHLDEMRNLGLPILFDRNKQSYILTKKCEFKIEVNML
jgi:predicted DNA-binding transcriptional regulator YafY